MKGAVECDEDYVAAAGPRASPTRSRGGSHVADGSRVRPVGGALEKEKPPIFGIIERGGEVRIVMLENVQ